MAMWRKRDIEQLLSSVNTHNTFETASREWLGSEFTPSQCREKFNELYTKEWDKEEDERLLSLGNFVYSSPSYVSIRLGRPMGAVQERYKLLLDGKKPALFKVLASEEKEVAVKKSSKKEPTMETNDAISRQAMLSSILGDHISPDVDLVTWAKVTYSFTKQDLEELCTLASNYRVQESSFKEGEEVDLSKLRNVNKRDLIQACKEVDDRKLFRKMK